MRVYLAAICLILSGCTATKENHEWDLAVAIDGQIEFLTTNGTVVGTTNPFNTLKALTYDNIRHQFVVSDENEMKMDTIYSIPLTSEEHKNDPIIGDLIDDVKGLAIDPLDDVLYWSNPRNKTINYISLKNQTHGVFMSFADEEPLDLAIDSCRRQIYWTNSNFDKPSIDRANLDGTGHEILIENDLKMPVGIAIDFITKKLYWADMGHNRYFKIESISLEGDERDTVVHDTNHSPYSLAVDEEFVYWTDRNNNALWKVKKYFAEHPQKFQKVKDFKEQPFGVIAKHLGLMESPDCSIIEQAIRQYNGSTAEFIEDGFVDEEEVLSTVCLNRGEMTENGCVCPKGFEGPSCEIKVCYNYCGHGSCVLNTHGYPSCRCKPGFTGSRCEYDLCYNYCLNNGTCNHNGRQPNCQCPSGFTGKRCEVNLNVLATCKVYCENPKAAEINHSAVCNCDAILEASMQKGEYIETETRRVHMTFSEYLTDPAFLILCICMLITMLIVVGLVAILMKMRRRRPRINKRIIVNKNVTPLTSSRPPPTVDQCEITIENCCNMNVCETPCFEPPQLRKSKNSKDEKKNLLKNMETGDDLY